MSKALVFYMLLLSVVLLNIVCKKDNTNSVNLYIHTAADATSNAILRELEEGRGLCFAHCGEYLNYYLPESYSPNQWNNILASMAPETYINSSEIDLIRKYVKKGKKKEAVSKKAASYFSKF